MPKALLFHGGGPTAVLNASLCGAITALQDAKVEVFTSPFGIARVLEDRIVRIPKLDEADLGRLASTPGSAIGSGRDHLEEEDYETIARKLSDEGFDYLIGTGGNGTMDTVRKLSLCCRRHGIVTTGIPKTMDNDLGVLDHSPGYLSAALYMATSTREVLYDVHSLPIHVVVIEALGRNAGWITASSLLANDGKVSVDMILPPEIPFREEAFLEKVNSLWKEKKGLVIVASEGLRDEDGRPIVEPVFQTDRSTYFGDVSAKLAGLVTQHLHIKSRSEKPGLLSRSSMALQSSRDREEAFELGVLGARAALSGKDGHMSIILRGDEGKAVYDLREIDDDILQERRLPYAWLDGENFTVKEDFLSYIKPLMDDQWFRDFATLI